MRALAMLLALASVAMLAGCSAYPRSPVAAAITVDVMGPVAGVDNSVAATKVGKSEARGILLIAWGDASIATAAKNGEITRIHHVDSESLGVFGIYAKYETIVYGE